MSILKVKDGSTWVDVPAIVGPAGEDGYSPTVDVQPITGGHEVTITDADGPHSFDVMDGSSDDSLTAQVAQLWGNQLVGELSGTVDTAADAYAAPPMALTVEGASTQAGTPTPDAPQPILSVDELTIVQTQSGFVFEQNGFEANGRNSTNTANYYTRVRTVGFASVVKGETLTIDSDASDAYVSVSWYATDSYDVDRLGYANWATMPATATVPSGAKFARLLFKRGNDGTTRISVAELDDAVVSASIGGQIRTTVPDLLPEGTDLRSLPDGTRDTLALSYLRPSTREGWAWYSREVVQAVGTNTIANVPNWEIDSNPHVLMSGFVSDMATDSHSSGKLVMCNKLTAEDARGYGLVSTMADDSICKRGTLNKLFVKTSMECGSVANFLSTLGDAPIIYPLATPVITTLDPIELPELPAPNATAWCDGGSATPTFQMEYVQDTNIVIAELRAALADLATS